MTALPWTPPWRSRSTSASASASGSVVAMRAVIAPPCRKETPEFSEALRRRTRCAASRRTPTTSEASCARSKGPIAGLAHRCRSTRVSTIERNRASLCASESSAPMMHRNRTTSGDGVTERDRQARIRRRPHMRSESDVPRRHKRLLFLGSVRELESSQRLEARTLGSNDETRSHELTRT